MIFRTDPRETTAHDQLVRTVAGLLRERRWSVEEEPLLAGNRRPDIIAKSPTGESYVIEVKAGSTQAHLGAVAQVETYRDSLSAEKGLDATGVLIMAGEAPPQLSVVADRAKVELVEVPDALAEGSASLESRLAALA